MSCPEAVKTFGLSQLYLALSHQDKELLYNYTKHIPLGKLHPAQFLWMAAANLLPHGHFPLATRLLQEALRLAEKTDDYAHIHANLAQAYYDQLESTPDKVQLCLHHLSQTLDTGYFSRWAKEMIIEVKGRI